MKFWIGARLVNLFIGGMKNQSPSNQKQRKTKNHIKPTSMLVFHASKGNQERRIFSYSFLLFPSRVVFEATMPILTISGARGPPATTSRQPNNINRPLAFKLCKKKSMECLGSWQNPCKNKTTVWILRRRRKKNSQRILFKAPRIQPTT